VKDDRDNTIRLSAEQQRVVEDRSGHVQVIACAGSGKTEAISRRVAALIEEGFEPAQIVAFTFTERAADSLKARITRRVGEIKGSAFLDRLGPMFVGTIHGYCLRLLQNHVPGYGNFDVLDENRHAGLLSREHKRLELSNLGTQHWRPIFDFLRNVDVIESEVIPSKSLAGTPFGDCYGRYCEMLDRYHFLTYGQLITKAVLALQNSSIFNRVHAPLRHLIVDEYQDINPAQERLIELLAVSPVSLCVVGDDDQSIYQWRGSDVGNILGFRKRYRPSTSLPLSVNRRSRPSIIATANEFAKSIVPRLPKEMEPNRSKSRHEVHCWAAETDKDEADMIAEAVEALVKRGYRYRDIAVLYRSVRTSSPPLIEAFREHDIPFRCAGRTGLFLQPEASVLGKTYAWLCDNEWKNERFDPPERVTLDSLLAELESIFANGSPVPDLQDYLKDWKRLVKSDTATVNLVREYYKLLHILEVQSLDLEDPLASARMGCLARFSEILADFEHVTRRARYVEEDGQRVFRGGQDRGIYFYRRLFNYLQYYALDAYEDFEGEHTFDLDTVNILTVHQAKGLEWPVVFIPSVVKRRFPSRRTGEAQDWLIPMSVFPQTVRKRYEGSEVEERRLFYVAMTRAKDMLYISRFQRKTTTFQPSPFFLEVAGRDPEPAKALPLPPPFVPTADDVEEKPTVTLSELALYEGCPLRYRLSSSLGFQPQLVAELGYGNAVHHILRRVADQTRAKKRLPTEKEVAGLFEEEFYLPFANRPAFDQMKRRARQLVDKYLSEYSGDMLRIWETERPFELYLEKGIVKGRADVILDEEGGIKGSLAIVDYKTASEAKSDDMFAFQLAIYTAAGRGEGLNVQAAYLHRLSEAERFSVPVHKTVIAEVRERADDLIANVVAGVFPAKPELKKCRACDVRAVCKDARCGKYDL
jgi:ATP-dependent DNA helicase UvrD/PcrA